jgi:hypothetical protein
VTGDITANEAIALARQAIASADRNLKSAAQFLAVAEEQGKTQRQMAEGVGKSAAWVNRLLQWRRDGFPEDTPFGAQSQERDERHDERVREQASDARSGPEQEPEPEQEAPRSRASRSRSRARRSRSRLRFYEHDRTTLVRVLGKLGSEYDNEVLIAARKAEEIRQRLGLTWDDLVIAATEQGRRERESQTNGGTPPSAGHP